MRHAIEATQHRPLTPPEARDLLALLREPELPWKVYDGDDLMAAFETRENALEWVKGYSDNHRYTITGPDDACLPESVDMKPGKIGPLPAFAPTITFKPLTPELPTLDQMPELGKGGRSHRCVVPETHKKIEGSPRQVVLGLCRGKAHYVDPNDDLGDASTLPASDFIVLDADPPQPKTLADVPVGVWCEINERDADDFFDGCRVICRTQCENHYASIEGKSLTDNRGYGNGFPITRVLGYPVLNLGEGE